MFIEEKALQPKNSRARRAWAPYGGGDSVLATPTAPRVALRRKRQDWMEPGVGTSPVLSLWRRAWGGRALQRACSGCRRSYGEAPTYLCRSGEQPGPLWGRGGRSLGA